MKRVLFCGNRSNDGFARLALLASLALAFGLSPVVLQAAPTISYVQSNYAAPQTPQTTVKVTFTAAQVAGDLNIVVVGWNDSTATVSAVTDSRGNTYARAVGPTVQSGVASQSIYYAKNIVSAATGTNTVTVTFASAAAYPDIRILEYNGADPSNPVDVTAANFGNSATSSSGSATTTSATDLIFGANLVQSTTTGPGSGFTKRLLTTPDGDIAEDRMVTATGSYSATAPVKPSNPWIMQMIAVRTPSGATTPPTVSSVSPNSGSTAGGTAVTITGTNFAAGATVTFGGAGATNVAVVNSTTITATTPAGSAGAVTVTVTVSGQSGSLTSGFTYVVILTVSSVSPNSGSTAGGTAVTITGTSFAAGATVTFGGTAATNVVVVSGTQITATTPVGSAGAVTVTVTVNGQGASLANGFSYVLPPTVSSVSPNSGSTAGGTAVTITGTNFAAGATVTFGGTAATNVAVLSSTTITATTPAGSVGAVAVTVMVSGQSGSLTSGFTYVATLSVSSVSPNSGAAAGGTAVTVTGTNFAAGATVTFGGTAASNVVVVSGTQITATTPAGSAGAVSVTVTVNGQGASLANGFSYVLPPTVSSVSPNSGSTAGGTAVTITGTNFAAGATVTFGGAAATNVAVVNSSTITATTPAGSVGAATVTVSVGGQSGGLTGGFTYVVVSLVSFVQGNYAAPQSPQTTVSVIFSAAQNAGDLNVIVVGWNDTTATVNAVSDKSGNSYIRAVGPTSISGSLSQSIYYASNVAAAAAGANIVTVTFSGAAAYPDIRILEYNGANLTSPVDVTAASTGNSATSSSGSVTTTSPADLLFAANTVQTVTSGPGNGFTSRLLTSPDGDVAEDEIVTAIGSYSATAPLSSGLWIMQMVAFRAAPGGPAPEISLSATSINFGNEETGSTSNPQPVNLTNIGSAALAINSIGISGGNAGDFGQTNGCSANLAVNATCTINVTFAPLTTGARNSAVIIADNAAGSPQTITLTGTGTGLSVSPRVTDLTNTRTQQFTATNGSVTWSVDGVAGGSASSGTITASGLYTPPATVGTHTVTATTSSQSASATVYVTNYPGTFTYHNDNLRTGQNLDETTLTLSNVNQNQFGKLFSYPLDGIAFASPLYVANVSIPGQGYHNVVYVATENDSVYAFDADGLSATPLWHVSFLSSGVTTVPCADTGECGDIPTQIGITSTPVIDQTSGTIYVVAATKEGASTWVQRLHALDITTGAEKFGGPVVLQASLPGTGSGSSGGNVAFDPLRENQRPGILLNSGVVYLAFGSHGDNSPWHGWVLGYNATTLKQTMQYDVTPNGSGGGIWQGGGGLATDATGDIYFVSSNGDFDVNTGGVDYGDSVEKLSPSGAVVDYFTPYDQQVLSVNNLDLGAGGPVMLVDQTTGPHPHLLITAGKNGTIYVINRDNLGKYNASNDNQIVQSLPGVLPNSDEESGNFSTPVFFNGYVYFGAVNDTLKAFQLTNGLAVHGAGVAVRRGLWGSWCLLCDFRQCDVQRDTVGFAEQRRQRKQRCG